MTRWHRVAISAWQLARGMRIGDYLTIGLSMLLIALSWPQRASQQHATQCQIRQGQRVVGVYDLAQTRQIRVQGAQGVSVIQIANGKVRFLQGPCHNQYCVQQGWLSHANHVALCLPNQVSITLLGARDFDSMAY